MKLGTLGTCLSNLTAVMLQQDYGHKWLNNTLVGNSGLFWTRVIKGEAPLSIEDLRAFLGIDPNVPLGEQSLRAQYRAHAGLCDMDPSRPSMWDNLHNEEFDVILLDNLGDTAFVNMEYVGTRYPSFEFSTPAHLGANFDAIRGDLRAVPRPSSSVSADNWTRIIRYVLAMQPGARLFFTCAHYSTSVGDQIRYELALNFHDELVARAGSLPIEIIPPIVLPTHLTKLPDDRDHFDWSVYKALAGHVHISTLVGWRNWANKPLPDDVRRAEVDHESPTVRKFEAKTRAAARLRDVIAGALGIPPEMIDEGSGLDVTPSWDSLNHVNILIAVEQAFRVGLGFKTVTENHSVALIRAGLDRAGVIAADDPDEAVADGSGPPAQEQDARAKEPTVDPGDLASAASAKTASQWADISASVVTSRDSASEQGLEPRNVFADFVERALVSPDRLFTLLVTGQETRFLTYGWVLACATTVGRKLEGIERGSVVVIVLEHSPHLYTTFMGCVLAGFVPTFLPPMTPRQDPEVFRQSMAMLFERVRPAAVIASASTTASIPESDAVLLREGDIAPASDGVVSFAQAAIACTQADDIAFLQHSSGTTGHKKGVMLSHRQVLEQARLYSSSIGMVESDTVASWLPLYHDMGLITSFIIPTVVGARVVSLDPLEWVMRPTMLLDYIESTGAQYCWLPNFAFLHIVRSDNKARDWNLSSMRMFVNCSEACRATTFDAFEARYAAMGVPRHKLQVSYAMAENVFAVTQTSDERVEASLEGYLSCGRPLPGVEIEIRSPGVSLETSGVGEIHLRSTCLFTGYFARPDLTAERLNDGWYRTGDLGRMHGGELYVVGRVDDLIIVNGRNIIAHEVESDLAGVEGLAPGRALVAGEMDDGVGSMRLIVLAELAEGHQDRSAIEQRIRTIIVATCGIAPSSIALLPRGYLIKSTSGKLARAKSLEKFRQASHNEA